jgi:hypothetical protein
MSDGRRVRQDDQATNAHKLHIQLLQQPVWVKVVLLIGLVVLLLVAYVTAGVTYSYGGFRALWRQD